jgi:hypothetical protein
MADVSTRFRTFLLTDTTIAQMVGEQVHQGFVPETTKGDYVWFSRSASEPLRVLASGAIDPLSVRFDVEAISDDLDRAQALAAAIRSKCDAYRGTFGDSTTQGIFVEDHNDDYTPRGVFSDDVLHVASMSVEIF